MLGDFLVWGTQGRYIPSHYRDVGFSNPKVPVFNRYFQLLIFGFEISPFVRNRGKTGVLSKSGKQPIFLVFNLVKWAM
jgi:hypothetical protein